MNFEHLYIKESMNFMPTKKQTLNGKSYFVNVFDDDDEDEQNQFNVSNSNAQDIIESLGLTWDSGGMSFDIDLFIQCCDNYLKNNFGKMDPKKSSTVDQSHNVHTDMQIYKQEYENSKKFFQKPQIQDLLSRKFNGNTEQINQFIEQRCQAVAKQKSQVVSHGPTVIDLGRSENYLKVNIQNLRKLAHEGKSLSATRIIVA